MGDGYLFEKNVKGLTCPLDKLKLINESGHMTAKSKVYFLELDQLDKLPALLKTAGIADVVKKDDLAAIKIHFGEKGNKGHIKPKEIKPVIKLAKELGASPFLTDANTIYRGERTDAVHHLNVAADHEFHLKFLGAPVVIADGLRGNSYVEVEVNPLDHARGKYKHFKKVKIAEAIYYADSMICLTHFKGHELTGFGGAIKNLGMGCAARPGKYEQHNSIVPQVQATNCTACGACIKWCSGEALHLENDQIVLTPEKCVGCGQCILACNFKVFSLPWNDSSKEVQEKIAEYAAGAAKDKRVIYVNFINFITKYCDCFKTVGQPIMPDIGIVVSLDPVAIDQASYDLTIKHAGKDILKEETGTDGSIQLKYAESLGLGTRQYELI